MIFPICQDQYTDVTQAQGFMCIYICIKMCVYIYISEPDGSCRRPIKDFEELRNLGFPWVFSYRSYLSYLSYPCLATWLPGCLAP